MVQIEKTKKKKDKEVIIHASVRACLGLAEASGSTRDEPASTSPLLWFGSYKSHILLSEMERRDARLTDLVVQLRLLDGSYRVLI